MSTEELAASAPDHQPTLDRAGSAEHHVARPQGSAAPAGPPTTLVIEELLVEEISIDGMCGVY